MRDSLKYIVFCFAAVIFFSCRSEPAFQDELSQNIERINERCPAMIDEETRLEGIQQLNDTTIRYNYTLVKASSVNVDTSQFRRAMWPGLLSMVKISGDMRFLREHNTVIEYNYLDKDGKPISLFTIRPAHYKH